MTCGLGQGPNLLRNMTQQFFANDFLKTLKKRKFSFVLKIPILFLWGTRRDISSGLQWGEKKSLKLHRLQHNATVHPFELRKCHILDQTLLLNFWQITLGQKSNNGPQKLNLVSFWGANVYLYHSVLTHKANMKRWKKNFPDIFIGSKGMLTIVMKKHHDAHAFQLFALLFQSKKI